MAELAREGHQGGERSASPPVAPETTRPQAARTPRPSPQRLDELIGIAEGIGALGTGVLQVVSDFLDVDDEFSTLRAMVRKVRASDVDFGSSQSDGPRRVP